MYVLTSGWYSDKVIVGVTSDEWEAHEWEDSGDDRYFEGPFDNGIPGD